MDGTPVVKIVGKIEGSYVQKILQKCGSISCLGGQKVLEEQTKAINDVTEKIVKDLDIHLIDLPYYVLALEYLAASLETQLTHDQSEFCKTYRKCVKSTTFVSTREVSEEEANYNE